MGWRFNVAQREEQPIMKISDMRETQYVVKKGDRYVHMDGRLIGNIRLIEPMTMDKILTNDWPDGAEAVRIETREEVEIQVEEVALAVTKYHEYERCEWVMKHETNGYMSFRGDWVDGINYAMVSSIQHFSMNFKKYQDKCELLRVTKTTKKRIQEVGS
jgi:hypothetical protein